MVFSMMSYIIADYKTFAPSYLLPAPRYIRDSVRGFSVLKVLLFQSKQYETGVINYRLLERNYFHVLAAFWPRYAFGTTEKLKL